MKAVLMSIQPKWCELIANGKKTIEVRKSRPKLETPFKVYIYCTLPPNEKIFGDYANELIRLQDGKIVYGYGMQLACDDRPYSKDNFLCKKVIGEFVCDEITPLFNVATTSWDLLAGNICEYAKGLVRMARLTEKEMHDYAKGKNCFAYHISDLKIYDKPKELSEFLIDCKNCGKKFVGDPNCWQGCVNGYRRLTRPPQSWCYAEEL